VASRARPGGSSLVHGLIVGEEADERLAEGAREGLCHDVGAGGVDGGGGVAVLRLHRGSLIGQAIRSKSIFGPQIDEPRNLVKPQAHEKSRIFPSTTTTE
jgi:hypothetical protein